MLSLTFKAIKDMAKKAKDQAKRDIQETGAPLLDPIHAEFNGYFGNHPCPVYEKIILEGK